MTTGEDALTSGGRQQHSVWPWPAIDRARDVQLGAFQRYGALGLTLFLLAASKWGSYLPAGHPPYVADIVLGLLLWGRIALAANRAGTRASVEPVLWSGVAGLLVWAAITLAFGSLSQNALRDAAPYFYAIAVFLVAPLPRSSERGVGRAITMALVFHAAWVTLVQLAPTTVLSTPTVGGLHIFQLRTDFDSAACGLMATLALHRALSGRRPMVNLVLAAWGVGLVLELNSRAGLLAFVVQLAVIVSLAPMRRRKTGGRDNRVVIAALVACVPIALVALSHSTSVQRITAVTGMSSTAATQTQVGAQGTFRARSQSWRLLVHYIEAQPRRNIAGVGFGPDFLHNSGADLALLGGVNEEVRSPHNYLLNTWARLGLVGLGLVLVVIAAGVRLMLLVRRHSEELSDIDVLALLIVCSIPVAGVVGVILESPFGALPYFWALGHLSVRACERGLIAPFGVRRRGEPLPTTTTLAPAPAGRGYPVAALARRDPTADARTLSLPAKAEAKRRVNAVYVRWAPNWARKVSGHPVTHEIDLDVLRHMRAATHARLRDPSFLETELLPALGLSDENPAVFPAWLWPSLGKGLRCWQYPNQFGEYLARLSRYPVRSYLEIGVQHGGTFIVTVEYLERFRPVDTAVGIDLTRPPGLIRYAQGRDNVEFVRVDSASRRFRQLLARLGPFDLVLIDGDHSLEACQRDLHTVLPYANMVALHDIVDSPSPGVGEVWREAKSTLGQDLNFYEYTRQYDGVRSAGDQRFLGIGLAVRKRWL